MPSNYSVPCTQVTKVKSRTSSRVLVLNVGLLPTLQKFRSALPQYASRSSPRGFILEDPHIVRCAFDLFIFKIMKENAKNLAENLRRPFLFFLLEIAWKKRNWRPFIFRTLAPVSFGPWPWAQAFLSMASRGVLGLGLGLFFVSLSWPRALCLWLHLCSL